MDGVLDLFAYQHTLDFSFSFLNLRYVLTSNILNILPLTRALLVLIQTSTEKEIFFTEKLAHR